MSRIALLRLGKEYAARLQASPCLNAWHSGIIGVTGVSGGCTSTENDRNSFTQILTPAAPKTPCRWSRCLRTPCEAPQRTFKPQRGDTRRILDAGRPTIAFILTQDMISRASVPGHMVEPVGLRNNRLTCWLVLVFLWNSRNLSSGESGRAKDLPGSREIDALHDLTDVGRPFVDRDW